MDLGHVVLAEGCPVPVHVTSRSEQDAMRRAPKTAQRKAPARLSMLLSWLALVGGCSTDAATPASRPRWNPSGACAVAGSLALPGAGTAGVQSASLIPESIARNR